MKTLGIDYGKKKVGLAVSDGTLAEPLGVVRYNNVDDLIKRIKALVDRDKIEEIVVGVSEGTMGEESRSFANKIGAKTFDETLTTQDAQSLSQEAGINRKKRKNMEDAFAATVMLQNYLDK